ncbi:M1 family aminopeptidase [Dyadobacter subterraneus]|nr:M1 family aminopeptidase [Dyadobacter subterraneus]
MSLLRFEISYHFKQITFLIAAILFFILGFLMTQGSFGGAEVHKNGPYVISFIISLLSIFLIFVSVLFCSSVVLRDKSSGMDALIFSTGISKSTYFSIKLAGLFFSVLIVMFLSAPGCLAGSLMLSESQRGGFEVMYYLQPLLLFGISNVLFCASFIFAAAMWTQNVSAVYVTGVFLFILYFTASIFGNSPLMATSSLKPGAPDLLSMLADPFGLNNFFGETKNWPVWRRNHDLYPLSGAFLANRLLWTATAFFLIFLGYTRFKFSLNAEKKSGKISAATAISQVVTYRWVAAEPSGPGYFFSALSSQLRLELIFLLRQRHFLVIAALWMFLYSVELKENVFHGPYDIRFYATTAVVIEQLLPMRLALLLLVFYASELIHREHITRMRALVFSSPMPNAVLFLAKTVSLAILIIMLISLNIIAGLSLQLISGSEHITFLPYLLLYYYAGFPLLLFSVLIIFIQAVIPNKYLGMLLSLLIVGISIFGKMLGIDLALLRFGSTPALVYSAMNGFGHSAKAFNGFMVMWTLFALLFGILTSRWWPDGTQDTWWKRIRAGIKSRNVLFKSAVTLIVLSIFCTGFYIMQKSEGVNLGEDAKNTIEWQKRYEQKYKPALTSPQPVITAVKINTDINPDEQRYTVRGTYTIKNESGVAIARLWIGVNPAIIVNNFGITEAFQKRFDKDFNQYFYELKKPLLPGAEMSIRFSLQVQRTGYRPFDSEHSVVSNGSYIELEKFLPFFGYNESFELQDKRTRVEYGLPPKTIPNSTDMRYHLVDFENIVSTNVDQQIVTVGTLQKSWKKEDRSYFHYKTPHPVTFMFALSSARYEVMEEKHGGTKFRIFYNSGQTKNLPALMRAMKDAISYGNTQFSKYPLQQITLAEIPAYRGSATAYPGVIFSNEKYNFLVDASDTSRVDFIYATTVHETAHQWWANQIIPQACAGYAFLTESLAKYTEAMLCEKRLGKMLLRKYLTADNELYFNMRNISGQKELPLNRTWEQAFVCYQKGGLAMYAIKEVLGEKRVNDALKRLIVRNTFLEKRSSPDDFINELNQDSTPFEKSMIQDHLKKVMIYDNRIKILSSRAIGQNKFKLQLLVTVQKMDETGLKTQKVPTNDLVDIAVFGSEEPTWNRRTKPIYFQKYHLIKPETVIEIVLDKIPKVAAVDPYGYLPDEDQKNNIVTF